MQLVHCVPKNGYAGTVFLDPVNAVVWVVLCRKSAITSFGLCFTHKCAHASLVSPVGHVKQMFRTDAVGVCGKEVVHRRLHSELNERLSIAILLDRPGGASVEHHPIRKLGYSMQENSVGGLKTRKNKEEVWLVGAGKHPIQLVRQYPGSPNVVATLQLATLRLLGMHRFAHPGFVYGMQQERFEAGSLCLIPAIEQLDKKLRRVYGATVQRKDYPSQKGTARLVVPKGVHLSKEVALPHEGFLWGVVNQRNSLRKQLTPGEKTELMSAADRVVEELLTSDSTVFSMEDFRTLDGPLPPDGSAWEPDDKGKEKFDAGLCIDNAALISKIAIGQMQISQAELQAIGKLEVVDGSWLECGGIVYTARSPTLLVRDGASILVAVPAEGPLRIAHDEGGREAYPRALAATAGASRSRSTTARAGTTSKDVDDGSSSDDGDEAAGRRGGAVLPRKVGSAGGEGAVAAASAGGAAEERSVGTGESSAGAGAAGGGGKGGRESSQKAPKRNSYATRSRVAASAAERGQGPGKDEQEGQFLDMDQTGSPEAQENIGTGGLDMGARGGGGFDGEVPHHVMCDVATVCPGNFEGPRQREYCHLGRSHALPNATPPQCGAMCTIVHVSGMYFTGGLRRLADGGLHMTSHPFRRFSWVHSPDQGQGGFQFFDSIARSNVHEVLTAQGFRGARTWRFITLQYARCFGGVTTRGVQFFFNTEQHALHFDKEMAVGAGDADIHRELSFEPLSISGVVRYGVLSEEHFTLDAVGLDRHEERVYLVISALVDIPVEDLLSVRITVHGTGPGERPKWGVAMEVDDPIVVCERHVYSLEFEVVQYSDVVKLCDVVRGVGVQTSGPTFATGWDGTGCRLSTEHAHVEGGDPICGEGCTRHPISKMNFGTREREACTQLHLSLERLSWVHSATEGKQPRPALYEYIRIIDIAEVLTPQDNQACRSLVLKDPMEFVGVETHNIQFLFQYKEDAASFDERYRAVAGAGQAGRDSDKDPAESAAEGKGIEGEQVEVQSHHDLALVSSLCR